MNISVIVIFLARLFGIIISALLWCAAAVGKIYESREEIIMLAFFAMIVWLGFILFSLDAYGQSKFYSFPSRPGTEGAKGNAMLHTLLNENVERRNETTANAASITALQQTADASITQLRSATDASLTTIDDCGAQGLIFGRGHAMADTNDCIPSLQVGTDGRVSLQSGMKFGDYALCDSTTAGTLKYNATAKRMEFCNGSIWGMLGGHLGCSINFPAVTDASLDTLYDTTDAIYSGETATAAVSGPTPATIRRNGANTGMASGVTINQGNSVGIRGRSTSQYNQTANFTLDIGTYTACWQITTKQQDATPSSFTFTDLTNQAVSALVTSNAVTVGGFDGPLTVAVSGQGSPELQVGSGTWVTSAAIDPGQSLKLRLTTSSNYSTTHMATVSLGTYSTNWSATTNSGACNLPWGGTINHGESVTAYQSSSVACGSTCTSEIRSCSGGTLSGSYIHQSCSVASCGCSYIGEILHGGVCASTGVSALVAAPTDAPRLDGGGGFGSDISWGSRGIFRGATSASDGRINTSSLAAFGSDPTTGHPAAYTCANLTLNGYSDWYLPAKDELNQLYQHRHAIGGFVTGCCYYYHSSTEIADINHWIQYFYDSGGGSQNGAYKDTNHFVRCVRRAN